MCFVVQLLVGRQEVVEFDSTNFVGVQRVAFLGLPELQRSVAWLLFIVWLAFLPSGLTPNLILLCSGLVVFLVCHRLISERKRGISRLFSLLNAVWFGYVLYSLPLFLLYSLTDISSLVDMTASAVLGAAHLVFLSVCLTGLAVELLASSSFMIHNVALRRISRVTASRQFYIGFVLLAIYALNYINSGVLSLLSSGNRFEVTQAFESGKMWLIQYLMTGVTIAFVYRNFLMASVRNFSYYLGLFSVVVFWVLCLSMGNRRGLISVFLASALCFVARTQEDRRVLVGVSITFLAAGLVGVFRQDFGAVAADQAWLIAVSNFFGEFIYPGYTLVHSVELVRAPSFEFTWVSMFWDFLVSQLQGQRFEFYAQRLALEVAPSDGEVMGFAYLPVTEAYVNFGSVGAVLSGATMIGSLMFFCRIFIRFEWVYLLLLSVVLDINRGEFVPMVIQFFLICCGFLLTTKMRVLSA